MVVTGRDTAARQRRMFVAIELPPVVRHAAFRQVATLERARLAVRWEHEEKLHITLFFLGGVSSREISLVSRALTAAVAGTGALRLRLGRAGQLPPFGPPRAVVRELEGDVPRLRRLRERVAERLDVLGVRDERSEFHPHVTLGRVARRATPDESREATSALSRLEADSGPEWTVDRIVLFESVPGDGTTRYATVESFAL